MRKYTIVLFAITVCACINAPSAYEQESTSKTTILNLSLIDTTATKRSLKMQARVMNPSGVHAGVNNEGRANIQALSKLAELDKETWRIRKFDMWLSSKHWLFWKKNPKRLFKYFNLHKAGDKIDEKKRVIQWFRYATDYRAARGVEKLSDDTIYAILKSSDASETKLAVLFQSLADIDDVKSLATTMQSYQFKQWRDQGEIPESIENVVRNIFSGNRVNLGTDSAQLYNIAEEYVRFAFGLGAGLR